MFTLLLISSLKTSCVSFPLLNSLIFSWVSDFFFVKSSTVSLFILISVFNEDKVALNSDNLEINRFFSSWIELILFSISLCF